VALERMQLSRPLTHDMMKNFMETFHIKLEEVVINKLNEGIFYAKLICSNEEGILEIDSRTSDALALAVRFSCPIFTYESILEQAGISMEGKSEKTTKTTASSSSTQGEEDLSKLSTEELNTMLQNVLEKEDYIKAIAIRD